MKGQLSVPWGEFLSQFSWDWFVTLTFRDWVKSFSAHRLFGYFVRDLEREAKQPIFWFRVDEIGPHGGRFHLHALIGSVGHLRRMYYVDHWDKMAGYARILPFSSKRGAAYYVAKYVTKQLSEWELSDYLPAFRNNQVILPLQGGTNRQPQAAAFPAETNTAKVVPKISQIQFPMSFSSDQAGSASQGDVGDVYKLEVTRGRGRFREFNFPKPQK